MGLLFQAIHYEDFDKYKELFEIGAPYIKDPKGDSPIDYLFKNKKSKVLKSISEYYGSKNEFLRKQGLMTEELL